jgi:hypothetical protein
MHTVPDLCGFGNSECIQENISVLWPDENIQPVNNGERYEMDSLLIPDFKFTAHQ